MSDLPNYLPGTVEMYGVKQEALQIPQGTDIVVPIDLTPFDGEQLAKFTLKAILKSDEKSDEIAWQGTLEDGGLVLQNGEYSVFVKLSSAKQLKTGTYYLGIAVERLPGNTGPVAQRLLVNEQTLCIRPSPISIHE